MVAFEVEATDYAIRATLAVDEGPDRGLAEAARIAGAFPKSTKVYASRLTRPRDGSYLNGNETVGWVSFHAKLAVDGVNGGFNETGVKRYRSFRRHAERLGFEVEWVARHANSYQTEAEFEEAIR